MTITEIVLAVIDRIASGLTDGLHNDELRTLLADAQSLRGEIERAIIELRFNEIDLRVRQMDMDHEQQQRDEAQALAKGREIYGTIDDHIDVTMVDPDDIE